MIPIQIIGDSLVKRLNYFVNKRPNQIDVQMAIGVSGVSIHKLKQHLKTSNFQFNADNYLILWVGTNDIFSCSNIHTIKQNYVSLIRWLRKQYKGTKLILLGLPYYPKVVKDNTKLQKLIQFNAFLHTLLDPNTRVFFLHNVLDSPKYYHNFYPHNGKPDGIHSNDKGNAKLIHYLIKQLFHK